MWKRLSLATVSTLCLAFLVSSETHAGQTCGKKQVARYHGEWVSYCTDHHGMLKARVVAEGCNCYRVCFSGTFFGVIPFVYSAPMTVTGRSADGSVNLYARSKLPGFGDFSCYACMNGQSFTARYVSEKDRGRFVMTRR